MARLFVADKEGMGRGCHVSRRLHTQRRPKALEWEEVAAQLQPLLRPDEGNAAAPPIMPSQVRPGTAREAAHVTRRKHCLWQQAKKILPATCA